MGHIIGQVQKERLLFSARSFHKFYGFLCISFGQNSIVWTVYFRFLVSEYFDNGIGFYIRCPEIMTVQHTVK
ncbi:hypothetical protein D3C87_1312870 [compost metagenome]